MKRTISIALHTVTLAVTSILLLGIATVSETKAEEEKKDIFVETQSYGEFSHRNTNFSRDDYSAIAGWAEFRATLQYKQSLTSSASKPILFEPYLRGVIAASENSFSWENNFVYGFGLENRFLESFFQDKNSFSDLARRLRIYIEYLKMSYTKDKADDDIPDHDFRFGIDLWKEWNIPPNSRQSYIWGELWGNIGWRETNFSISDYKTYSCGAMTRIGVKSFNPVIANTARVTADVLPYLMVDTSVTGKDNFWENGLFAGAGIRFMSSLKMGGEKSKPLILKVFTEWLANIDYYKGKPTPETPDHDLRIGINFSYNLY